MVGTTTTTWLAALCSAKPDRGRRPAFGDLPPPQLYSSHLPAPISRPGTYGTSVFDPLAKTGARLPAFPESRRWCDVVASLPAAAEVTTGISLPIKPELLVCYGVLASSSSGSSQHEDMPWISAVPKEFIVKQY